MKLNTNSKEYIFYLFLLLGFCIVAELSYFRFMVKQDYIVYYEGECDPSIESCFIGCEDDECTEEYYYTEVYKYAPDLYRSCGEDIIDCTNASVCLPTDQECSVTYCDPDIDDECAFEPETAEVLIPDEMATTSDILLEEDNLE